MTTPNLLQIDDHNPLVLYSPNSSWIRGGAAGDFDGTSTFTSTTGASATLTFTGTGISVWGTINFLLPNNTPTYVLSSYSIDDGPTTTFNATEVAAYKFQQKLFQSATLTDSTPHTIVVTLVNNGTFFIDYFLVIPSTTSSAGVTSTSTSSSSTLSTTTVIGPGGQFRFNRGPIIGAAMGGILGGFVLLTIAILTVWLCRKKRPKNKNQIQDYQTQVQPFTTPPGALPMQQYQPHEGSDRVSEPQSYPTTTSPLVMSSSGVIPQSKGAQLSTTSCPPRDSLQPRPLTESPEPPGYAE